MLFVVLNLFGGFIIASIINPYKVNEEDDKLLVDESETKNSHSSKCWRIHFRWFQSCSNRRQC